ncbi:hypothetical protein MFLAVUS_001219 [Mucor flavus]|uniref:Uncharacterized protein n=1 Tax=Mucor flavus TaxID=439312 RepID=A0ABP9YLV9_9FUNG
MRSLSFFVKAREAGHVESQNFIERIYYDGLGITQDYSSALFWHKISAEKGDAEAQRMTGLLYYKIDAGDGPDYKQALEWLLKSANSGDPAASKLIACMYFKGKGTMKDHKTALGWFKKVADNGETDVFYITSRIYLSGEYGVDRDFDLAETWLMKGIEKEDPDSMWGMGLLQGVRNGPKQSWEKAFEWCTKAAEYNSGEAQNILGKMHERGLGCKKDYKLATEWYKKAEENGVMDAIANIGSMYHYGHGVPVNYTEDLHLYQKADDCGSALNHIGLLYQNGLGVNQSRSKAMLYFKRAEDLECEDSYNSIGEVYKYGYGRDVDLKTALEYYTKSAKYFSEDGMFSLGLMYMEGSGTEVNKDLALYWVQRADLLGNEKAKKYIDEIVKNSAQLPQIIHSKEDIQLLIQEKRSQGIQLRSMEEKLAILMAENGLLKKTVVNNTMKDTEIVAVEDKKPEPIKFLHLERENINRENKDPIKIFHL